MIDVKNVNRSLNPIVELRKRPYNKTLLIIHACIFKKAQKVDLGTGFSSILQLHYNRLHEHK